MQITTTQGNFIEKIVRDANGKFARVTFCVYENAGHIKARIVKVVYLEECLSIESSSLVLTGFKSDKVFQSVETFLNKIVSPYFNSKLIYFSGSKPRAPTF